MRMRRYCHIYIQWRCNDGGSANGPHPAVLAKNVLQLLNAYYKKRGGG